jgi:Fur family transcriptional regulator, ferric uptake regulator
MDQIERFKRLLSDNGYSVTKPRLDVFKALLAAEEAIAVTELIESLPKADKVSVYRSVELFEKIGIAQRVWFGFKSRIELSEEFSPHHHHFTCIRCQQTISLHSDRLEYDLKIMEAENGFTLTHHSIELKGYCRECMGSVGDLA